MARELIIVFAGTILTAAGVFALFARLVARFSAILLACCGLALLIFGPVTSTVNGGIRLATTAAYLAGAVLLGLTTATLHQFRGAGKPVIELGLGGRKGFVALPFAVSVFGVIGAGMRYSPDPRLATQRVMILGAVFFFAAYGAWSMVRFRRRAAITENGVLAGYRFLPWPAIKYYRWLNERQLVVASETGPFGMSRTVLDVPPRPHDKVEQILAEKVGHRPTELSIFHE